MIPLASYRTAKTWQEKVLVMNLYHKHMAMIHDSWSVRKTAKYFEKSIGLTSENLMLAKVFEAVKHFNTRQEALDFIKDI